MLNPSPTQVCTICQEYKPSPGHFIVSYNKMETSTQCKDCRSAKKKIQAIARCGKTEKAASWKHSMNKLYRF